MMFIIKKTTIFAIRILLIEFRTGSCVHNNINHERFAMVGFKFSIYLFCCLQSIERKLKKNLHTYKHTFVCTYVHVFSLLCAWLHIVINYRVNPIFTVNEMAFLSVRISSLNLRVRIKFNACLTILFYFPRPWRDVRWSITRFLSLQSLRRSSEDDIRQYMLGKIGWQRIQMIEHRLLYRSGFEATDKNLEWY